VTLLYYWSAAQKCLCVVSIFSCFYLAQNLLLRPVTGIFLSQTCQPLVWNVVKTCLKTGRKSDFRQVLSKIDIMEFGNYRAWKVGQFCSQFIQLLFFSLQSNVIWKLRLTTARKDHLWQTWHVSKLNFAVKQMMLNW